MSELKSPLTFKDRLLLKSILPLCRQGVHNRESFKKLAKTMVLEGRIPDEDILFYMTIEDIDELIKTRSPKIISKANHRRRRHPVIDKYIFPELIKGFPIPVNMGKNIVVSDDSNFSMKGIPVSQGSVVGNVRVALDLEEASLLQ
ncbi:phosphoenolpyruvate synthase, partial [Caerostris extrusa]